MALSYPLRLLCLIACSVGAISLAAEITLWTLAPMVLRLVAGASARRQETVLYALQIVPIVLASTATALGILPAYIVHESNFATERVGWFCLALACITTLRFGWAIRRACSLLMETVKFTQACRRSGDQLPALHGGMSIVAMREMPHGLALVGLLRPLILISSPLLEPGGLDPLAFEVALDHERAHAHRKDNWKMFSLHALPSLNLRLPGGRTWMQHWRAAAECAADDDAVHGESTRALLLAQTLVAFSRNASTANLPALSTTLISDETDFAARVERLLEPIQAGPLQDRGEMLFLASALLGGALALALLFRALTDLPEHLLHLG